MSTSARNGVRRTPEPADMGADSLQPWEHLEDRVRRIVAVACRYYRVRPDEVYGRSRKRRVCDARHVAMLVVRDQMELDLETIGQLFNRDHTTVIHGRDKVTAWMHRQPEFAALVRIISREATGNGDATKLVELSADERRTVAVALKTADMGSAQLRGKFDG